MAAMRHDSPPVLLVGYHGGQSPPECSVGGRVGTSVTLLLDNSMKSSASCDVTGLYVTYRFH